MRYPLALLLTVSLAAAASTYAPSAQAASYVVAAPAPFFYAPRIAFAAPLVPWYDGPRAFVAPRYAYGGYRAFGRPSYGYRYGRFGYRPWGFRRR